MVLRGFKRKSVGENAQIREQIIWWGFRIQNLAGTLA